MAQWFTYPPDSPGGGYGEMVDPVCANGSCHYLKPDTNIRIPSGVPVTAWDGGIITDVSNRGSGDGGLSVTMRLNHPINSKAGYASFNFLGSATVHIGQVVSPGTQIGIAGSPLGINFALGLSAGPSWPGPGFPQGRGDPAYDPRVVLRALNNGTLPSGSGTALLSFNNTPAQSVFLTVSDKTTVIINNVPGFRGLVDGLDNAEQFQQFNMQDSGGGWLGLIGMVVPPVGAIQSIAGGVSGTPSLPSNAMQAFLSFVWDNLKASVIRLLIILIGLVIVIALIMNAMGSAAEDVVGSGAGKLVGTGIKLSGLAA